MLNIHGIFRIKRSGKRRVIQRRYLPVFFTENWTKRENWELVITYKEHNSKAVKNILPKVCVLNWVSALEAEDEGFVRNNNTDLDVNVRLKYFIEKE